ncbi:HAD family hydrolase [Methylobacterium radiodurans]|uniref:HAD family hydrolase n=1 Tax=Methylobacterium radiodurans TaxID=2202828 RepID=UPI0024829F2E|nr:HAD family phosphatase [Methylobacterium radiodurans]
MFDMDGLLFDTERLYLQAMIESVAAHGHEMTDAFYKSMLGQPGWAMRERILAHYGAAFPLDGVRAMWRTRFGALCEDHLALKPGVPELLDLLQRLDIPCAIATSSRRYRVMEHLRRHALADRFRHVVAQEDYALGKPHPAPYLTAAHHLGAETSYCLALEDSHNGVRAAAAAGMMTIMVPDLLTATEEIRALCLGVARDLIEVASALARFPDASGRGRTLDDGTARVDFESGPVSQ